MALPIRVFLTRIWSSTMITTEVAIVISVTLLISSGPIGIGKLGRTLDTDLASDLKMS